MRARLRHHLGHELPSDVPVSGGKTGAQINVDKGEVPPRRKGDAYDLGMRGVKFFRGGAGSRQQARVNQHGETTTPGARAPAEQPSLGELEITRVNSVPKLL